MTDKLLEALKAESALLVHRRTYLRLMQDTNIGDYEYAVYCFIFTHLSWRIARVRLSIANITNKDKSLAMRNLNSVARDMRTEYKEVRNELAKIRRKKIRLVS